MAVNAPESARNISSYSLPIGCLLRIWIVKYLYYTRPGFLMQESFRRLPFRQHPFFRCATIWLSKFFYEGKVRGGIC